MKRIGAIAVVMALVALPVAAHATEGDESLETASVLRGMVATAATQAGLLPEDALSTLIPAESSTGQHVQLTLEQLIDRVAGRTRFASGGSSVSQDANVGQLQHAFLRVKAWAHAPSADPLPAPAAIADLLAYRVLHTTGGIGTVTARDYSYYTSEVDFGTGFHAAGIQLGGVQPIGLSLPLLTSETMLSDASFDFVGVSSVMQGAGCAPVPLYLPMVDVYYVGNLCAAVGMLRGVGIATFDHSAPEASAQSSTAGSRVAHLVRTLTR